jgi:hypothetical protein
VSSTTKLPSVWRNIRHLSKWIVDTERHLTFRAEGWKCAGHTKGGYKYLLGWILVLHWYG